MFKMVRFVFQGYKRFFLDAGHEMRIILLCEAIETRQRSRMESHHLMGIMCAPLSYAVPNSQVVTSY